MSRPEGAGVPFVKGHGTENDFVILPDEDAALDLTPGRVRAVCDRHGGIGGDGVLRVVRTRDVPDAPTGVDGDTWFMDYRNADGSVAEMCGNGVRVFATYLVARGLADPGELVVGTRTGPRRVRVDGDGRVTVDMGRAVVDAASSPVRVSGRSFDARAVDVGNPHLVALTDVPVADLDVATPPGYDGARFPHGVNVEVVNVLDTPDGAGTVLDMRVHERGVGETRACGTGTVATVAAWLASAGRTEGAATVRMPGGAVTVTVSPETCTLTGPAVLLASGTLDPAWWDAAAPLPV